MSFWRGSTSPSLRSLKYERCSKSHPPKYKIVDWEVGGVSGTSKLEEIWIWLSRFVSIVTTFSLFTNIKTQVDLKFNIVFVVAFYIHKSGDWVFNGRNQSKKIWENSVWVFRFIEADIVFCRFCNIRIIPGKKQFWLLLYWKVLLKQEAVHSTLGAKFQAGWFWYLWARIPRSVVFHCFLVVFGVSHFRCKEKLPALLWTL